MHLIINSGFDKTVQNIACHMHDNGVQSKVIYIFKV